MHMWKAIVLAQQLKKQPQIESNNGETTPFLKKTKKKGKQKNTNNRNTSKLN